MKKTLVFLTLALNVIPAFAYRIEYGSNVTISQPVHEDLYITGGTVTINAPVYGDLIIGGGTIFINDTVTNDILLAGGNTTFNGYVGDDLRCVGGTSRIQKNVLGDVVVAGGEVFIIKGATVGGLAISGGNVTVDGDVNGEVHSVAGNLFLNGNMANRVDCRGGKITVNGNIIGPAVLAADAINIGQNASFRNSVRYWNREGSLDFNQALKGGTAVYDPSLKINGNRWYYLGAASLLGLLWYMGMALLMTFVIQYLFAAIMKNAVVDARPHLLKSLGIGFLYFVAVPIAVVVGFITLIGIPVALLVLFAYIILLLLATVITAVTIANWLNYQRSFNWSNNRLALAAFGIFILLKLLTSIPFIGWLILFLLICSAFGTIIRNIHWRPKSKNLVYTTP
jgi:hypothetical protein